MDTIEDRARRTMRVLRLQDRIYRVEMSGEHPELLAVLRRELRVEIGESVDISEWLSHEVPKRVPALEAVGEPEDFRVMQWVENPLATTAELMHQKERAAKRTDLSASAIAQVVSQIGMEQREVDQRTLLGGFCRFNGTEEQNKAVARFKTLYERAQLGGAKAMDPSKEPVDGGGINPESVLEIGADARRELATIASKLLSNSPKTNDFRRLEFVVILERGPTPYAKWRGFGTDGRACSKAKVEVRRIADVLAVHWGYAR